MKSKIKMLAMFFIATIAVANAQVNLGIDYLRLGDYSLAKKYFEQQTNIPSAQLNYYLGEIAFAQGKMDEAKAYYIKGVEADQSYPFNVIGLAKIDLKTNQTQAESAFNSIQRANSSNIDVKIAISYAYIDNGMKEKALAKAEDIRKQDSKNPKLYLLEGDIYKASKELGEAATKYDMAIYFDPDFLLPYIKSAEMFENAKWNVAQSAVEKLNEVLKRQPAYTIAYRYLGKIYTNNGFYAKGVEAYKAYFAAGYYEVSDISRYVTALYFNQQYEDAKGIINEGLKMDPNHFVLHRFQMYTAAMTHDTINGQGYAQAFFNLPKNGNEHIVLDYTMYASLLKDQKKYDEAIAQYNKALALDKENFDLYKEMSVIFNLQKDYASAAENLAIYITKEGKKAEMQDYFQLGRYYYFVGTSDTANLLALRSNTDLINKLAENPQQKDSMLNYTGVFVAKVKKYYAAKADSALAIVTERVAEYYPGFLWRARANSLLDPETELGLAKPYYEKTIELILAKNETGANSTLIEAYRYLGYYYYVQKDFVQTQHYCNKLLELDPKNEVATNLLKAIKQK